MASFEHPEEDTEDLFVDDLLLQESDTVTLPLLDFCLDDAILTLDEQTASHSHLQQTPFPVTTSHFPASIDHRSTDDEVLTFPLTLSQQSNCSSWSQRNTTLSPAARVSLLDSSMSTHSPLPSGQKLLVPKTQSATQRSRSSSSDSKSVTSTSANTGESMQPMDMTRPMPVPASFSDMLPYALPVAYHLPSHKTNQKRALSHVIADATPPSVCGPTSPSTATATDSLNGKKSKREIRQMKNRESANKSRLRSKARLATLTTEVTELKKKEQKLQTIVAGLRAENKSLLDQNTFLRSLVTSCKHEAAFPRNDHHSAVFASLPPGQSCVALNMVENGQKADADEKTQAANMDTVVARPSKRRAVASVLSTASVAVCGSVFGITVFTNHDGDVIDSVNIRGAGRVLHEASTSCGVGKCSSEAPMSLMEFMVIMTRSWWRLVSSSELMFGVLLNVLFFIIIVCLYQLWQWHSAGGWSWKYAVQSRSSRRAWRQT